MGREGEYALTSASGDTALGATIPASVGAGRELRLVPRLHGAERTARHLSFACAIASVRITTRRSDLSASRSNAGGTREGGDATGAAGRVRRASRLGARQRTRRRGAARGTANAGCAAEDAPRCRGRRERPIRATPARPKTPRVRRGPRDGTTRSRSSGDDARGRRRRRAPAPSCSSFHRSPPVRERREK